MMAAISKAKKSTSIIHLLFEGKGQSTKVKTKNRCANTMQNKITDETILILQKELRAHTCLVALESKYLLKLILGAITI
jgi:hypothetical protein